MEESLFFLASWPELEPMNTETLSPKTVSITSVLTEQPRLLVGVPIIFCSNNSSACIAEDGSVVQLGRTFVKNGMRHKCEVRGDSVSCSEWSLEAMFYTNGRNYEVGESFKNGFFHVKCTRDGFSVDGELEVRVGYVQHSFDELLLAGESRLIDQSKNECQSFADGRLHYVVEKKVCFPHFQHNGQRFSLGQIWIDGHVRYSCHEDGNISVLGCVDGQLFLEVGRDLLMNGYVHRCYQVDNTAFYHRFSCPDGNSLSACIAVNTVARARRF